MVNGDRRYLLDVDVEKIKPEVGILGGHMDYPKDSTAKLCLGWGMEGSVCWQGGRSRGVPRVWFAFFVVMLICLDHEVVHNSDP